jgi:hypothetical protein
LKGEKAHGHDDGEDRAIEQRRPEQVGQAIGSRRPASRLRRRLLAHWRDGLGSTNDPVGLFEPALLGQPSRRFGQRPPQEPNDARADGNDHEHPAPAESRDHGPAHNRRQEQARVDDQVEECCEAPAIARRNELAQCAVADDDFGAQSEAHEEARDNQPFHGRTEGACERRAAEQHQIELIAELAAQPVADDACGPGADHHSQKG